MKPIKTGLLFLLSFLFGAIIFVYIGNFIGWDFIGESLKIFFNKEGSIIIFLSFFIAFLGTLRWNEIIKSEGISKKVSLFNLFKIYIAGFSIIYFFPIIILGSEFFRASLLEHREKIGWDKSLASVFIERIIEWTVNILVILIGTLYFFYQIAKPSESILIIFSVSVFITLIALAFIYFYIFGKRSFVKNILLKINKENNYKESLVIKTEKIVFDYFNIKNFNLWKGYFLSIVKALAMLLRVWLIVVFLGNALHFMESFSVLGFSFLSTLIPIPTSLGIQELVQAFAFENLNISLSVSSAFSMILRAGDVMVSITGFVLFFKTGYDFFKNKILQK